MISAFEPKNVQNITTLYCNRVRHYTKLLLDTKCIIMLFSQFVFYFLKSPNWRLA